jgi:hypothetical protein
MALYVYAPVKYEGTLELVKALGATRLLRYDGLDFWDKKTRMVFNPEDIIFCWGYCIAPRRDATVINGSYYFNRLNDATVFNTFYKLVITSYGTLGIINPQFKLSLVSNSFNKGYYIDCKDYPGYASSNMLLGDEYRFDIVNQTVINAEKKVATRVVPKTAKLWESDKDNLAHPFIKSKVNGWEWQSTSDGNLQQQQALKIVNRLKLFCATVYICRTAKTYDDYIMDILRKVELARDLSPEMVNTYAKSIKEAL